ncbi:BTB/POZ domain-containing protein KCTD7-like isoform X2 [Haliotis asinina]|uniref:BTB/POZ domain-containing protein KCTD7-like isoform X2 n=1 Tax=Haliotis asinina TaxID=109174 RepID=UPI003531E86E
MEFPDVIDLNVGGRHLTTSLSTLRKYPDSMLAAMFSGRYPVTKDTDGRFFIDVDGDAFLHILNFLRFQTLPPPDAALAVHNYAEYFGLRELCKRQQEWGPVFVKTLKEKWKGKIDGYEACLRQVRDGLLTCNFDNGYFYILFSDLSKHIFSRCNVPGISDGHLVISVTFYSSKTLRSTLIRFLNEDLRRINVFPDGDEVFRPESSCECRVAFRYILR